MLLEQCLLEMKRCKAVEETFKKKKKKRGIKAPASWMASEEI